MYKGKGIKSIPALSDNGVIDMINTDTIMKLG